MASLFSKETASLPEEIPVFPLAGVLLLPGGTLPLNIFEKRYLAMIEDILKADRLIGMIQPRDPENINNGESPLFDVGCAGRLTAFEETDDGRYLITLTGLCRFRVARELPLHKAYRCVLAHWDSYKDDMEITSCLDLDRSYLKKLLGDYFSLHDISCDWDAIDGTPDQKLVTCLSMICPFNATEKQALLEAQCCRTRADMFVTMLEMAVRNHSCGGGCH
ncbi:MAG: peptidase S16 [Alphaproteobacteria bacterium CG_4_9_14_3_um_filter_47_13]|nr:MAG: peptidase S16 [Alphaproteobacteria bacterium CG_4_9_14_3_um_filter_47_13]